MDMDDIKYIRKTYEEELFKKYNIVGLGIGFKKKKRRSTKDLSLKIFVKQKVPSYDLKPENMIPNQIDGVLTDIEGIGDVYALPFPYDLGPYKTPSKRIEKYRPAPPGVSIGHYKITAGTFGAVMVDKKTGERLILTNNHAAANSNDAKIGDPILQPGPYDGGKMSDKRWENGGWNYDDKIKDDVIGQLKRYVPIVFEIERPTSKSVKYLAELADLFPRSFNYLAKSTGSKHRMTNVMAVKLSGEYNEMDAAVASPLNPKDIIPEILDIGPVKGVKSPELRMKVQKSGRTTELTKGRIEAIDVSVRVGYGFGGPYANFKNQIVTGRMSSPGDSGSLLLDYDNYAVGLLFAGSTQSSIYNPIDKVLKALEVEPLVI